MHPKKVVLYSTVQFYNFKLRIHQKLLNKKCVSQSTDLEGKLDFSPLTVSPQMASEDGEQ